MHSLFGEEKNTAAVITVAGGKKNLTKNQQTFNRLTARIAALRNEIASDGDKLRSYSSLFAAAVSPLMPEMAKQKLALAKALYAACQKTKLTAKQRGEAESFIVELLEDSFTMFKPDEASELIYNSISGMSYQEVLEEDKQDMKEELQDQLFDLFGIDIEMDDFDQTPEGYIAFQQKIKEQLKQQQGQPKKKKTKKQLQKEASQQQQEELKRRSIRNIYLSLAKLLHPDTEPDETAKREKEEVMKEITAAYNENNLAALLQLELRWIAKEKDHLEKIADETLNIYINVFKTQVKELETEKLMQLNNPVYDPIRHLYKENALVAAKAIENEKKELLHRIAEMEKHVIAIESGKTRNAIRECLQQYYINETESINNMEVFHEMMDFFAKKRPFRN